MDRSLTIDWEDPRALGQQARSMPALEFLGAIRDGKLPPAPIQRLLGFTLETKFNLVRPITAETGRIAAEGRVVHRGRTTATSEGYLRDASGKLLAHGTSTCLIIS